MIACEDTRVTRKLLDPLRHRHAARALSRAQCGSGAAEAAGAAGRRRDRRAGVGRRHAADLRSRLQARARGLRGRLRRDRDARRLRGAGGTDGSGAADRPVFFRRLSAGEGRPAGGTHRRAGAHSGDAGAVRERPAASAATLVRAGRRQFGARAAAICRELTKLHEEVRRGDLPALANALYAGGRDARRNRHCDRSRRRRDADRADDVDDDVCAARWRGSR